MKYLFYLGLLFCSLCANSQEDSLVATLREVVIKENRLEVPFSDVSRRIDILTKDDLQALGAVHINDLLQVIGGVDIRQRGINGVQADLSIRGGTFEQALVLVNGVKMIDPQTGHHMMNLPLDVEDIERIEVIKGPAARIYGQNAYAGAINIVTKIRTERSLTLSAEGGSHSLFSGYLKASYPVGNYKQDISYSYNRSDGYRFNTDYMIQHLMYQSEAALADGSLRIFGGLTSRDFGANGFYGNESFTEQYEEVNTSLLAASYEKISGNWKITPRLSWRRNKDNWQFMRSDPEFFQNFHTSHVVQGEINSSYSHAYGFLGIGMEYNYIDLNSNNLGDHNRHQYGIHLENRFLWGDERFDLTPGVYIQKITDKKIKLYPGIDFGYRVRPHLKVYANAGFTSRIPSFTDLYYEDRGNVGNPDLKEESAFTWEVGGHLNHQNTSWQVSYFRRNANDLIDWFREKPDDKWMPDNFNSAIYQGIDFSGLMSITAASTNISLMSLRVNYMFIHASFEDHQFNYSRNELENLRHQLIVAPRFSIGKNVGLNFILKYNDRVSLEDYVTVDARIDFTIARLNLFARCQNLFDQIYRETNLVPMPGRWVSAGGRYTIN